MSIELQQGLMITAIGMGLVFVVIIFLWWMMSLLVKVTTQPEKTGEDDADQGEPAEVIVPKMAYAERLRRTAAAAAAVGLALEAEKKRHVPAGAKSEPDGLSPWQGAHRARQLQPFSKRG